MIIQTRSLQTTESTHSFPAVIRDHESPTVRRMMKMVPRTSSVFLEEPPQRLEVNLAHPVLHGLHDAISAGNDALARDVTQQIFDNAKVAAGIMDDPRVMLKRINRLLAESLGVQGKTEVVSERLVKETVTKEESA